MDAILVQAVQLAPAEMVRAAEASPPKTTSSTTRSAPPPPPKKSSNNSTANKTTNSSTQARTRTPPNNNTRTERRDRNTPPADRRTPPADRRTPAADRRTPAADRRTPPADRRDAPPAADRRDAPPAADRRDAPPAADRRDARPAADRRDAPLAADRRDAPPAADRRDAPPAAGPQPPPPAGGPQPPPPAGGPQPPPPAGGPQPPPPAGGPQPPPPGAPRGPVAPAERRAGLDRIATAERDHAEARRAENQDNLRRAQGRIDEESRRLYGHLYQPRATPRDQPALDAEAGRRFMGANAEERDRMLASMPAAHREQLSRQLRDRRTEVDRQMTELLRNPAQNDPRVQELRREHERLDQESQRAWRAYNDARHQVYQRESGFGPGLARVFGRDSRDVIVDRETRDQHDAARTASGRASTAEAAYRRAAANPTLTPEQQRQRTAFEAEQARLDAALGRVGLGPASRADAEGWLRATGDARNRDLANGTVDRDRGESMRRHLDQMHRDLSTAPAAETADQRTAREARLREVDAARHRLQYMGDAPAIYDARRGAEQRTAELEAARRGGRRLTDAENREIQDNFVVRTGADRLRPEDNMHQWSRWERDHHTAIEQDALRREWQQHVAQNPQALVDMERNTREARDRAIARLPADQRAAFERNFELQTTFGRDDQGNLTYRTGYAPTAATTLNQTRQSLAAGLHESQPAMEIARHYRREDYVRPGTPQEAMLWQAAVGDRRPGELMTRSGGGGLRDASMDFLWVTPAGAIRNMGAYTVGQFVRAAGTELAVNAAFGTAIHAAGEAVTDRFGERYGAAVPVVALLGTLATGRVMASPRVQAGITAVRNRVGQALGRGAVNQADEAATRALAEVTGTRAAGAVDDAAARTGGAGGARTGGAAGAADDAAARTGGAGGTRAGGAAGAADDVAARAAGTPRVIPRPNEPRTITTATRHTGADPAANIEAINRAGLQPRHTVSVDNVHYSFSDPFPIGGGRVAVLGVVDDGASQTLRVFYRSNSQGNFRLLPAQNQGLGHLGLPGFDKAIGETALGLPAAAEARLAGLVNTRMRNDIAGADGARIFGGAAPVNRTGQDYMNYVRSPDYVGAQVRQRPIIEPPPGAQPLPVGRGHEMLRPQDVRVPEAMAPNFNATPVTYRTQTATAGEVEAMVFPSANGQLEWTLFRDQSGRTWVANVGSTTGPVTNLGVRANAINTGELTTPLWEYTSQIPRDFIGAGHATLPHYSSAWSYIRELPVIQNFYRSRGVAVPP